MPGLSIVSSKSGECLWGGVSFASRILQFLKTINIVVLVCSEGLGGGQDG